jgi:hypothetical protein
VSSEQTRRVNAVLRCRTASCVGRDGLLVWLIRRCSWLTSLNFDVITLRQFLQDEQGRGLSFLEGVPPLLLKVRVTVAGSPVHRSRANLLREEAED